MLAMGHWLQARLRNVHLKRCLTLKMLKTCSRSKSLILPSCHLMRLWKHTALITSPHALGAKSAMKDMAESEATTE